MYESQIEIPESIQEFSFTRGISQIATEDGALEIKDLFLNLVPIAVARNCRELPDAKAKQLFMFNIGAVLNLLSICR